MKPLRKMVYKPVIPLGNGATVCQEASHFIHHTGNQLMVLSLRMELRARRMEERRKEKKCRKETK